KEGKVFVLDRGSLGGFHDTSEAEESAVVQRFFVNHLKPDRCPSLASSVCWHVHGSPVLWRGPMGSWMYVWTENDDVRAFSVDGAANRFDCLGAAAPDCNPISKGEILEPEGVPGGSAGMPGGFLSISAHGSKPGSGILWATHPWSGNANQAVR